MGSGIRGQWVSESDRWGGMQAQHRERPWAGVASLCLGQALQEGRDPHLAVSYSWLCAWQRSWITEVT